MVESGVKGHQETIVTTVNVATNAGRKELSEINREYSEEYAGTGTDE